MNEPLIGPSEPSKVWTPSDDAVMRRAMVTLWVASVVAIQVAGLIYQPQRPPENLYLFAFWLGSVWAGWAVAIWASSRWVSRPLTRVAFLIAMFAWHGFGFSVVSEETTSRYVVMLGSYGLIQAVVFHWVGIPRWRILRLPLQSPSSPFGPDSPAGDASQADACDRQNGADGLAPSDAPSDAQCDGTRQFGIGDLIAITTVVAVLITAGKSYETLLADSFWWGLVVGEAVLLAVAVLSVLSGLSRRLSNILGLFLLATATGVGGSVLLDFIETVVTVSDPWSLWPIYAVLMTTFSALLLAFAALSMTPLRTRVEVPEAAAANDKSDHETGSQSPL